MTPGPSDLLLDIDELSVSYPSERGTVQAVRDLSFFLRPGEVFCIVGESGCGKSATCRAIMGLLETEARCGGRIMWRGENLRAKSRAEIRSLYAASLSLIPQSAASLNPLLSIGEHIEETILAHTEGASRRRIAKAAARRRAVDLLGRFSLADPERAARSKPHELSGGMKQRALVAVAFACDPDLLIADEPTKGLDLLLRDEMIEVLLQVRTRRDTAMLLVTHDLELAASVADRVGVIYSGVFLEAGPADAVIRSPRHPYTKSLVESLPRHGLKPTPGFAPSALEDHGSCPFRPRCAHRESCAFDYPEGPAIRAGDEHASRCALA